jgi:hypothetical protein
VARESSLTNEWHTAGFALVGEEPDPQDTRELFESDGEAVALPKPFRYLMRYGNSIAFSTAYKERSGLRIKLLFPRSARFVRKTKGRVQNRKTDSETVISSVDAGLFTSSEFQIIFGSLCERNQPRGFSRQPGYLEKKGNLKPA